MKIARNNNELYYNNPRVQYKCIFLKELDKY